MEQVHRDFNVPVAAEEHVDDPSLVAPAVVAVSRTRREVRDLLARVADAVAAYPRVELSSLDISEV
jgi:uncharacterized protein YlxP (DUF503 family)